MLGGGIGLGFVDLEQQHQDEGDRHQGAKHREAAPPAERLEEPERGDRANQIGRRRAADTLNALGETQVAAIGALGADVPHDRVAGHLQEGRSDTQQEDTAQEQGEAGGPSGWGSAWPAC